MSQVPSTITPSADLGSIFKAALEAYKEQTKKDITSHPLAVQLQSCDSPSAILAVLRAQVQALDQSRSREERLTRWLDPTVNVLCAFSTALGNGIGLIFPPSNAIFVGIGVLLQAAKSVRASQDALVGIFGRIEPFFKRLEAYIEVRPTAAMMDVIVKIMVEVLSILGIVTKEIRQGRTKKYLNRLAGRKDVEDALRRLDQLTQEEVLMAAMEALKITRDIDDKVKVVDDKVEGVDEGVQAVYVKVEKVDEKVQSVGHNVGSVIEGVKATGVTIREVVNQLSDFNGFGILKDLRKWISPPDPSVNFNTACKAHHEDTAAWCTQGNTFADWKVSGSLLWIHGKPGSGKTILSSVIIRDIKPLSNAELACMAYFFFDFKDTGKQGSRALLSSIVIQLSQRSEPCYDVLLKLYSAHDDGSTQPTVDSLMKCLKDMLTIVEQMPVNLIVDALDECPNDSGMPTSRETVLELVEELVGLRRPNLRLCVTSRLEFDICNTLEGLATHQISLQDESGQTQDLIYYVISVVRSDRRMKKWRDDDQNAIIEHLSQYANGMFQWVFCQLDILRHCFPTDIRHIIKELPQSLEETYERILKQIHKPNRRHAHRLLQCLMVALRPLRVEELAELLALDFSTGAIPTLNTDWRWEDQEEAVLSACSSLVSVNSVDGYRFVQFTHFSVKEFLRSDRLASSFKDVSQFHISLIPSHTILTHACLGALVRLGGHSDEDSLKNIPLARYAAQYWVVHAANGSMELPTVDAIAYFLELDKPHFSTWVKLKGMDTVIEFSVVRFGHPIELLPSAAPLYFAARFSFYGLVEYLIVKYPQQLNACGGEHGTPLHVAVLMGHIKVAQLLFAHGADINSCSQDEQTPLHLASQVGNLELENWLLSRGADVDLQDFDGSTPLHLAASNGHFDVSRILIEHNANANALDNNGCTPFHNASANGNADIVQLSLNHRADAHARDERGKTPLHLAASRGHLEIVRMLLALDAEVNSMDNYGSTPFLSASVNGNPDVVRLLLDHNAVADVRDKSGNTSLHMAAFGGHLEVAQILLERNAELNAQDDEGSTALHQASGAWHKGHPEIVKLLLDHGAEAHLCDNDGKTVLHTAAFHGCLKVSQILLGHNAEINARDNNGSTPLLIASKGGYLDVVQLLLDHDADAHVRDKSGNTALHLAAAGGGFELELGHWIKLFEPIDEVNSRKSEGSIQSRPTSDVGGEGSPNVVQLLLDHGVGAQVCNIRGETASDVARGPRWQLIVQLLSGDAAELTNETGSRIGTGWDSIMQSIMYQLRPYFDELGHPMEANAGDPLS